jgi:glycosyltransferase involved in cell wall biosynthesis
MEQQKISVIIPVYKVEAYLEKCVMSVLCQTYQCLEIILVDDGSPDGCPALCDELAQRDGRIQVIHKENGGLSSARNAGIEAATGDYLFLLDSDDYIVPEALEKLYRALTENGADMSLCDYARVDEQGQWLDQDELIPGQVLSQAQALALLAPQNGWWRYSVACCKLYRRQIFDTLRFPVGKIHEDEFVMHHVFGQCQRVAAVPERLYMYVQRPGSIMAAKVTVKKLDAVEAFFERCDFYKARGYEAQAVCCLTKAYGTLWRIMNGLNMAEYEDNVRPYVQELSTRMVRRGDLRGLWLRVGFWRRLRQDKKIR